MAFFGGAFPHQMFPPPEQVFQLGTQSGIGIAGFGGWVGGQVKGGGVAGQGQVGFARIDAGDGFGVGFRHLP